MKPFAGEWLRGMQKLSATEMSVAMGNVFQSRRAFLTLSDLSEATYQGRTTASRAASRKLRETVF